MQQRTNDASDAMPLNDDARHGSVAPVEKAAARRRLRRLSHSLDSAIALPGGYRVGWDGAIGLIPGIGDLVGAALSSYIVLEARRLGVPLVVLLHMSINVLIETAVGVIPVVGDLFDFIWKANRRNVQLLESHLDDPGRARGRSSLVVAVMIALMGLVIAALIALALWLLGLLASVL